MVVSKTNALLFQVVSRFPERSGFTGDGSGCGGESHALKQFRGRWNDFKKFSFKVYICRFAYTTYEKTLIELKTYVRGLPLEEFDGFLIKMQTLNEVITDFTTSVFDR